MLVASGGHKVDLRLQLNAETTSGLKTQMRQRGTGVESQSFAKLWWGRGESLVTLTGY